MRAFSPQRSENYPVPDSLLRKDIAIGLFRAMIIRRQSLRKFDSFLPLLSSLDYQHACRGATSIRSDFSDSDSILHIDRVLYPEYPTPRHTIVWQ